MLRWRLTLEEYGLDIEYIKGDKNLVADSISTCFTNRNQETTQESTYKKVIVLEIYDAKELPEGIFPINFNLIDHYQRKEPRLKAKYKLGM